MSFILDALKKSETDRQQRGSAEFAGVPTNPGRREGPPRWLWLLGALLFINLAVLIGILMQPDVQPEVSAAAQPGDPTTALESDFVDQVAEARQNAPPRAMEPIAEPVQIEAPAEKPAPRPIPAGNVTTSNNAVNPLSLPTIQEVQANGLVSLPELHVDIHVYSESAEDRFVFINMNKQKEGSRLAEGPLVEEITPNGVVLTHNGTTFLLPRD